MSRCSAKAFDTFIYALVMTDQDHVAEILDRNKTAELVQRRDAERGQISHPIAQPSSGSVPGQSAMAPSGSAVVTTSSSGARVPHMNAASGPSQQCTPTPLGMCLFYLHFCAI